jgi:tyrosinase
MIRYRRNIACLTTNQLHDLREALAILFTLPASSPHSWQYVAGIHGLPSPTWCIHGAPGFLTWHRAYLLALEEALQCLYPDVTVPYWNWSSGPTTGVPSACAGATYVNRDGDTVPNPLYAGPLPPGAGASMTNRRSDIDTTSFADLATSAQAALTNDDFDDFQNALNSVHGSVHVRVSGHMGSVAYAGFDPIFWLHHANVDRLWSIWQNSHPGATPPAEQSLSLDPFTRPDSTAMYVGSDMESTDALGYRYRNWCLIVLGPFTLSAIRLKLDPWWRERLRTAKLSVRATRMAAMSMELRVFVNDPDADERTPIVDNPAFAGSFGIFGMTAPGPVKKGRKSAGRKRHDGMKEMMMRGDRFDMQLDITEALKPVLGKRATPTLKIVAVDSTGRAVPPRQLDFDGIDLIVR